MAEEEIYRALFEQSNDAIFITEEECILEVNPQGCKLLGYDRIILKKFPTSLYLLKNPFPASRMQ